RPRLPLAVDADGRSRRRNPAAAARRHRSGHRRDGRAIPCLRAARTHAERRALIMPNLLPERPMSTGIRRLMFAAGLAIVVPGLLPAKVVAQLDQRDEQFYYPGDFNWKFVENYPEGARLFNAFDYGHAVLYEKLYTTEGEATDRA